MRHRSAGDQGADVIVEAYQRVHPNEDTFIVSVSEP
jgi:hypothetical protein